MQHESEIDPQQTFRRKRDYPPRVLRAARCKASIGVDAFYLADAGLIDGNRPRVASLVLDTKLPTTASISQTARAGALMAYGPNYPDLFRRAAEVIDKILRGASPGDIPVEQPTKFYLVINLESAKALGLTVPNELLLLADEVVE